MSYRRAISHSHKVSGTDVFALSTGTLYVVATPIGNLDDLSPRAKQALTEVDLIAAEDTRHTGKLLAHFGIATRKIALHDHNEAAVAGGIVNDLLSGKSVALVSDAGTPLISDPGYRLVMAAQDAGVTVSPIPGPSAMIAALSVAGLPSDRFAFEGFLPAKHDARMSQLKALATDTRTLIFYESVHRIGDMINDLIAVLGNRDAFIGREISKLHEQCLRAPLAQLHDLLETGEIVAKGEFVVIVAGASASDEEANVVDATALLQELVQVMPGSQAVDIVTKLSGQKRNDVYKQMLALKG
jgi:16S rRNA (cytidine1402-2'-O)-methyltransferase